MAVAQPRSPRKEIVRAFHQDLWNKASVSLVAHLMRADGTFRARLGLTTPLVSSYRLDVKSLLVMLTGQ